jgi:hypothetical protein
VQQKACLINENQVRGGPLGPSLDPRPILLNPMLDRLLVAFLGPQLGLLREKNRVRPNGGEISG